MPQKRRRRAGGERVYPSAVAKWQAVAARAAELQRSGRPLLIGTSSVEDSEQLSEVLTGAGIDHRVLNARQDNDVAGLNTSNIL